MVEVTTSPTSSASDGHSCDDVRVEGALQQREGFYEQWMESNPGRALSFQYQIVSYFLRRRASAPQDFLAALHPAVAGSTPIGSSARERLRPATYSRGKRSLLRFSLLRPLQGCSHMEDRMEGTDEIETSPMSRRSRREPKVPGKLLPLLECLGAITSHKFGSLFEHKLESQNKQQYRNIIRQHMHLGMIRARLEEGSYSGSQEFFQDLLLVFKNALIFYPKSSQEHRAAVVLRELANNEMAKIFQTETLLKQEGPSTRKRDPRAIPGPPANATKFNPSSRKRNARPLLVGARAAPRSKTTSRLNTKEEQYNSQEPPKEAIEVSSSAGLKPENEPEDKFEAEAPNRSKMPKAGDERKTSGISSQPKKGSGFHNDPKKNSNTEPKKTTIGNTPLVESRNNSHTHKSNSHSHHHNNNGRSTEQLLGKVAAMKEEKGTPPPEPTHKQRTSDQDQPSPLKRGVGRPPKHVKRASGADDEPPSKATGDPEAASRARKRLRK